MSAKRTKSSGPTKKDQNPPADPSEDSTTTGTASESVETGAEPTSEPDTINAAERETPAADDGLSEDTSDTLVLATEDTIAEGDETETAEEDADHSGDDTVETGESKSDDTPESVQETGDEPLVEEEPVAETESESKAEPEPQERVVERVVETRSVFVPAIFGGVVAGLVGFAAASTDQVSGFLSGGASRVAEPQVSAQEVAALRDQIAALEAKLAEPAEAPEAPDLSGIEAQITDGLAQQTEAFTAADAALNRRVDDLSAQLTDLAQAPVEASVSEEVIAAYEAELGAVQAALAQQRADVETMIADAAQMEAEATESARKAQAQAAATRLFAALDTGGAFSAEVTELQSLGVTVPDALVASAGGLTPLGALQAEFPGLARKALAAARDETAGSSGFSGFLQRQLGARSVTPRDGDDPDAVLSRAEAALTQGDLSGALSEIDALPDTAKAALSDWSDAAAARQAALTAADDLAQSLASN